MTLTLWQSHVEDWGKCTRCYLHKNRENVVLARGNVPAEVLFVGEAPGFSEDEFGKPFVGPAGHVLDQIIQQSLEGTKLRYCISNLLGCIPTDDDRVKVRKPPADAVETCTPRVVDLVRICDPQLIVCIGDEARDWINPMHREAHTISNGFHKQIPTVKIVHPSWILRQDFTQRNRLVTKQIVVLRTKIDEMLENPTRFAASVEQDIMLPSRKKVFRQFSEDDIPF